jgi:hypothetical protein
MDQTHNNRTLETKEFQKQLLAYIMHEYDQQSFKDPVARWVVESLMQDGFSSMGDEKLRGLATKWFPEKFPNG